jgi:hypothetical protein
MSILKQKCSNMSQGNKFIGNIINEYNENEIINNPIIKDIIKYHPTKNINVNNLEWIKMLKRKPYNKLALYYKYNDSNIIDDISWRMCIRNIFGKWKKENDKLNNIKTTFRNEMHSGSRRDYLINNTKLINNSYTGICVNCNKETNKINIDHYPKPFKIILDDFIKSNNIILDNLDVKENNNSLLFNNRNLAEKWKTYHDNNASYRILCQSCNSHFGSYGF